MANKEQKRKTREAKKPKQKKKESPKEAGQQGATSYQNLKLGALDRWAVTCACFDRVHI